MADTELQLPVDHVSDTAYLVALCRALESAREDAVFHDPLAAILAAPKAQLFEKFHALADEGVWIMTVRTYLLDRMIQQLIASGVDTVLNLAAGLDTRPYRLPLPKDLRWIEADLPGMIAYKSERLATERPVCRLERIAIDLTEARGREKLFADVDSIANRALVITEGLLPYLDEQEVSALARSLSRTRSIREWLMDVTTDKFLNLRREEWHKQVSQSSNVVIKFAPSEGARFFERLGWNVAVFDSFLDAARKIDRIPPFSTPAADEALEGSGVALLTRA